MLFQVNYLNEEENKTIETFVNTQLIPTVSELENLAISSSRFRVDTFGIMYRHRLSTLQQSFRDKSKLFLTLYNIYTNPDKLFADLKLDTQKDKEQIKQLKSDYDLSKDLVAYHMDRGFRMIELLQSQLDNFQRNEDARLAVSLSVIATTVSVISITFSFFY